MHRVTTIDAEVAGEAVRLVVGGGPSVPGRSMAEKTAWFRRHGEALRTCLMLEPRGHAGMHGALLTEPVSPMAHAGLISMHAAGCPLLSGEGVIAAVTIALEHGLIAGADEELLLDTPVGLVRARPQYAPPAPNAPVAPNVPRVSRVALTGVPSFVHSAGLPIHIGTRTITVDIAFGGEFYAIADSEAIGIPIDMVNASRLVRMGLDIKRAVEEVIDVVHPTYGTVKGVHGTIFTGAPHAEADLRSATVLDGEVLRRSPGATGTAALMAVLEAMGLLTVGQPFTHEGVLGTRLQGRILSRYHTGEMPMVVPVIEGAASMTGFHEFVCDD